MDVEIRRIRNYPGTFHIQPTGSSGTVRTSDHWPWELAYAPAKDGYGAAPGVLAICKTKRQALAAFDKLKQEIFANRREDRARYKRLKSEGYYDE